MKVDFFEDGDAMIIEEAIFCIQILDTDWAEYSVQSLPAFNPAAQEGRVLESE